MNGITTRTSLTHPLQISPLPIPAVSGQLGLTLCPGKTGPGRSYYWKRDLAADVAAIEQWPAAAVVTLVEQHELELLGVENLGAHIGERAIEWFHLPIADYAAPDSAFERLWPAAFARLSAHLLDGHNVVLHCRGGLGRAGTVAAMILREFGAPAPDAIAEVRAARPGAIETDRQEAYVRRYRPLSRVTA
ncbi:MAG TPA: cyclin-dependent kinase inhibitor 3 family protein [Gammaproteobacteria bacterium]|nr:cyclin-dependent kinase inhibitor 3 family protein [Gammaproteobacteria bacterium]